MEHAEHNNNNNIICPAQKCLELHRYTIFQSDENITIKENNTNNIYNIKNNYVYLNEECLYKITEPTYIYEIIVMLCKTSETENDKKTIDIKKKDIICKDHLVFYPQYNEESEFINPKHKNINFKNIKINTIQLIENAQYSYYKMKATYQNKDCIMHFWNYDDVERIISIRYEGQCFLYDFSRFMGNSYNMKTNLNFNMEDLLESVLQKKDPCIIFDGTRTISKNDISKYINHINVKEGTVKIKLSSLGSQTITYTITGIKFPEEIYIKGNEKIFFYQDDQEICIFIETMSCASDIMCNGISLEFIGHEMYKQSDQFKIPLQNILEMQKQKIEEMQKQKMEKQLAEKAQQETEKQTTKSDNTEQTQKDDGIDNKSFFDKYKVLIIIIFAVIFLFMIFYLYNFINI